MIRKLAGWFMICFFTYKFFELFGLINDFIYSLSTTQNIKDWIILIPIFAWFFLCFYIYAQYVRTIKCSHCKTYSLRLGAKFRVLVRIISWSYKYENKDGTPDKRRKNNSMTHIWEETYRCMRCRELTVINKSGTISNAILKQAKSDVTDELLKGTKFEEEGVFNNTQNKDDFKLKNDNNSFDWDQLKEEANITEEALKKHKYLNDKWKEEAESKGIKLNKNGSLRKGQIAKMMADKDLKELLSRMPDFIDIKNKVSIKLTGKPYIKDYPGKKLKEQIVDSHEELFDIYIDKFNGSKKKIIGYLKQQNPTCTKKIIKFWLEEVPFNASGGGYYNEQDAIKDLEAFRSFGAEVRYEKRIN